MPNGFPPELDQYLTPGQSHLVILLKVPGTADTVVQELRRGEAKVRQVHSWWGPEDQHWLVVSLEASQTHPLVLELLETGLVVNIAGIDAHHPVGEGA